MKQTNPVKRTPAKPRALKNRLETPAVEQDSNEADFNRKVQEVAYQLYIARGCAHGHHVEDWIAAEEIVRGQ